jgi:hypothetical protein
MQPVGAGGRALHIPVRRGSGYTFLDHGPMLVTLLPGGRASFAFGGSAWDLVDDTSCLKVIAVRVIPPGDHTPLITPVHAVGCREGINRQRARPRSGFDQSATASPSPTRLVFSQLLPPRATATQCDESSPSKSITAS